MICRVCRSESFSQTEGGDYVCEICGTQSQDYANEVVEFESNITSARHVKTKKKVEKKEVTLLSYEEGFQMVIQRQIETMISRFGCSENLYQIVGQLWLQFLKKYYEFIYKDNDKSDETSQVLVDDEEEQEDKDEQESFGQSDPAGTDGSAPENTRANNTTNLTQESAGHLHTSSDPLNNTNTTDKSNVNVESHGQDGANGDGAAAKPDEKTPSIKVFLSRKKPKFSLTVCFIYLGCLWCREPLDISDIMRWMRSGELPFVSVINSLPRNIDKISFLKSLQYFPTCAFLTDTSKKLAAFLDFSPPPLNPPPFVYRLFQDLGFPPQLYGPTLKLLERADPQRQLMRDSLRSSLPMRAVLTAYVIVAMKMCLAFDDDWDRDLAPISKRLSTELPFNNLREWIDQRMKMLIKSHITHPWNLMELHRMPKDGFQTYLDFCRNQIFSNEEWPTGSREVSDLFEVLGRSTAPRSRSPVRRRTSFGSQNDVSFDDIDEGPAKKKRKLDNSLANPAKQYTIYKRDKNGEFHRSYHFMLQICARHIDTSVEVLQSAVVAVEQQLLK